MKVKQSISIEQELLSQLKVEAVRKNCTLSHIVDRALYTYLNPAPSIQRQIKHNETDSSKGRKNGRKAGSNNSDVLASS